jgi:AcrR family transcriptional regulator
MWDMTTPARGAADKPPRRLLARDERQAQLLRAAATAFAHAGFAGTSMDDVAAAAGVTKLIVYRHFDSKDELYRAVLTQVAELLRNEFERALAAAGGRYRPGFASRGMLRVARQNPDGFRLLTRHAMREPEFAGIARQFRAAASAVADAVVGDMIPDPVIKAWAGPVMVDYLVQSVLSWLDVGDESRDDELVRMITRGLRAMFLAWADPDRVPVLVRDAPEEEWF